MQEMDKLPPGYGGDANTKYSVDLMRWMWGPHGYGGP